MPKHTGKNGLVKFNAGTEEVIANVTEWSLSSSVPTEDATAMGDAWKDHVVDVPEWSGSMSIQFDHTAVGHDVTLGETGQISLHDEGDAAGKKYFSGQATVTGFDVTTPRGSLVTATIAFTGKGALSVATVPSA